MYVGFSGIAKCESCNGENKKDISLKVMRPTVINTVGLCFKCSKCGMLNNVKLDKEGKG